MLPDRSRFRVEQDQVVHSWAMFDLVRRRLDNGSELFERTFVDSPGAVGVVAVDDRDHVFLVEQYRPSLDRNLLEIPAGMRDVPGEDPLATAKRELLEETGLSGNEWIHLGACVGAAAVTNSRVEIFLARGLTRGERMPHGPEEEAMQVRDLPIAEAVSLVMSGGIVDAKTSIGLLMYARRFGVRE